MDQAEFVYFTSASRASNNREENCTFDFQISWNPLQSKSIQKNHVCWLKMKFCFSSLLITSWLCQIQSMSTKDFEICWRLNSRSDSSESPNTYWVSVWSLWRMGFPSLNACISCVLSSSTKETRSTTQWSPIRLQQSFWNLIMKNSILICTASSSEVWYNSLPGQDQIFHIRCQFFPYSFQIQLKHTGHGIEE